MGIGIPHQDPSQPFDAIGYSTGRILIKFTPKWKQFKVLSWRIKHSSAFTLRPAFTTNPSTSKTLLSVGRRPGIDYIYFSCSKLRGMEDKIPFILPKRHAEHYIVTRSSSTAHSLHSLSKGRTKHFAINSHNTLPLRKGNCSITTNFSSFSRKELPCSRRKATNLCLACITDPTQRSFFL
jgi:hypothetical protein